MQFDNSQMHYAPFTDKAVLPWQKQAFTDLLELKACDRLPHAMLISGANYIGKADFARRWIWSLFCELGAESVCGECKACHLLKAGTHPDFINIMPEDGKEIRIDTIRGLTEKLNQTAQQGGKKICLLSPAESMNENSANALLKILEEPPANTFFILLTHSQQRLLPTIISRCHQLRFPMPERDKVKSWLVDTCSEAKRLDLSAIDGLLDQARGFPLKAKMLLEEGGSREQFIDLLVDFIDGKMSSSALVAKLDRGDYAYFLEECLLLLHRAKKRQLSNLTAASSTVLLDNKQISLEEKLCSLGAWQLSDLVKDILSIKAKSSSNVNLGLFLESFLCRCRV